MHTLLFCSLTAAAVGIDVGWQPGDDGALEYIIQIEPHLLATLKEGDELTVDIRPELRHVRRYKIVVGNGQVPRTDLKETAAKEPVATEAPPNHPEGAPPDSADGLRWKSPVGGGHPRVLTPELSERTMPKSAENPQPVRTAENPRPIQPAIVLPPARSDIEARGVTPPEAEAEEEAETAEPDTPESQPPAEPAFTEIPDAPPGLAVPKGDAEPAPQLDEESGPAFRAPDGVQSPAVTGQPDVGDRYRDLAPGPAVPADSSPDRLLIEAPSGKERPAEGLTDREKKPAPVPARTNPFPAFEAPAMLPVDEMVQPVAAKKEAKTPPGVGVSSDTLDPATERQDQNQIAANEPLAEAVAAAETDEQRPWLPLTVCLLALFGSLGGNLFLGWVTWDARHRLRRMITQLRRAETAAT